MKNLNFAMASLSMAALQAPAKEWSLKLYDITKDSWSFRNHGSYLSPGGLCAGFVTTCIGNYYQVLPLSITTNTAIGNTTLSDSALEYLDYASWSLDFDPTRVFSLRGSPVDVDTEWRENRIAYNLRLFDDIFDYGKEPVDINIYNLTPTDNLSSTQDTLSNVRNVWGSIHRCKGTCC